MGSGESTSLSDDTTKASREFAAPSSSSSERDASLSDDMTMPTEIMQSGAITQGWQW